MFENEVVSTQKMFKNWTNSDFLNEDKVIAELETFRNFESYVSYGEWVGFYYLEKFKNNPKDSKISKADSKKIKKLNKADKSKRDLFSWEEYEGNKVINSLFNTIENIIKFHNEYFKEVYSTLYNDENKNWNNLNSNKIYQTLNSVDYEIMALLLDFHEEVAKIYGVMDLKNILNTNNFNIKFDKTNLTKEEFQEFKFDSESFKDALQGNYGDEGLANISRNEEEVIYRIKNLFDFFAEAQKMEYKLNLKEGSEKIYETDIKELTKNIPEVIQKLKNGIELNSKERSWLSLQRKIQELKEIKKPNYELERSL